MRRAGSSGLRFHLIRAQFPVTNCRLHVILGLPRATLQIAMPMSLLKTLLEHRSCAECVLKPMCRPAIVRADEVETLAGVVIPRRPVAARAPIYKQGGEVRALFVSQGGVIKTEKLGHDGRAQVIGFHFPGELMGLEAMEGGRFRASAIALEPAIVCEIPIAALERVASRDPAFQHQLIRAAGSCLSRQQDHVELLALRQADERIAIFLLGLLDRIEALSGRNETVLQLPMSRGDLASYLCMTIETVSRGFSRMRDERILDVRSRHLRVLDRDKLALLANLQPEAPARRA